MLAPIRLLQAAGLPLLLGAAVPAFALAAAATAAAPDAVTVQAGSPAARAAGAAAATAAPARGQSEADEYTRYELLAPESASFHILYEVTATTAGATSFFNPIRKGSVASGEAIFDRATGKPLAFKVVTGEEARRSGLPEAELEMSYLRVELARPVPPEGGARLLIEKTYKDARSYFARGADRIVFTRPLGIRRNSIVLPAGYELVACNIPSQVLSEADGRIVVSFMHAGPDAAPLTLEARRLPAGGAVAMGAPAGGGAAGSAGAAATAPVVGGGAAGPAGAAATAPVVGGGAAGSAGGAGVAPAGGAAGRPAGGAAAATADFAERLAERAHQDRTIVYFLRQPETHAFDLYHDYTETREGTDKYLNVVRPGSASSNPSARNLDTGETLQVETLAGDALQREKLSAAERREVDEVGGGSPGVEVVVARFPPVPRGGSMRLRISETYTDPRRYRLDGERLVFDRTFGRPRDAVVLPAGWYLTASSIPATVTETADGRIRLDFVNARPDEIAVLLEALRRPTASR
jgi:hypothetical protein